MSRINIFGRKGLLTDDERKKPLSHGCDHVTFQTNIDLSEPIKIIPYGSQNLLSRDDLNRDLMIFICWWTINICEDLNGFSGFHNMKFDYGDLKIV